MKIDQKSCTGCGVCVKYCPSKAISLVNNKAKINYNECFECSLCWRFKICPTKAILYEESTDWPRVIRGIFSDPISEFSETKVKGRGTEEMKTADVTNKYSYGEVGISIDVGRPSIGTSLKEVEKIVHKIAPLGFKFEEKNPLTFFLEDKEKGIFKPEIKEEKAMSAIIEGKVPETSLIQIVEALKMVSQEVDTVFCVGIISRVKLDDTIPAKDILESAGWKIAKSGKVNLGLGKI